MIYRASPSFWREYSTLGPEARRLADRSFATLKLDPQHLSLHLKKAGRYWSARIGLHHRALAVEMPGGLLWFWIGDHNTHDRLIG